MAVGESGAAGDVGVTAGGADWAALADREPRGMVAVVRVGNNKVQRQCNNK